MGALREWVLGQRAAGDLASDGDPPEDASRLNMGPSHPAMHGTVRIVLTVEGERVIASDVQPGFLHRGFEKECEAASYTQILPFTDRLNYASPLLNNVGFAEAVEKLLGIRDRVPERAQYIRVIVGEMSRIVDHITCLAATAMELGAFTPFLYWMKAREGFYELLEEVTGARLTGTYVRIGGVLADLTDDFAERLVDVLGRFEAVEGECETMLVDNKIFTDRMVGVGVTRADDAIAWGMTGPILRAAGVDYDVRKDYPYLVYDRFEFDVPVGAHGDCYDRYLVRLEEMRQSVRILRQAMRDLPGGPILLDDPAVAPPPKREAYDTIEGMIRHFKHYLDGIRVPAGETYSCSEGANGELGFYVLADGSGRPYKCYLRSPSFVNLESTSRLIEGHLIADVVPVFGMINMIGGECDK